MPFLSVLQSQVFDWLNTLGPEPKETESNQRNLKKAASSAAIACRVSEIEAELALLALKKQGLISIVSDSNQRSLYRTVVLQGSASYAISMHEEKHNNRPQIFISCGQCSDEERSLGLEIATLISRQKIANGYFAQNQSSFEAVTHNILKNLSEATGFIGIMHHRGVVSTPDGATFDRASVWVEQEVAIAAFIEHILKRPIRVQLYIQKGIKLEGLRDKVMLNAVEFERSEEIIDDLKNLGTLVRD